MAASRQDGLIPAISMENLTPKTEKDSIKLQDVLQFLKLFGVRSTFPSTKKKHQKSLRSLVYDHQSLEATVPYPDFWINES